MRYAAGRDVGCDHCWAVRLLALTAVACGSCDTRVCGRIAMRMGRVGRCGPVAVAGPPRRVRSDAVRSRPVHGVHAPAVRRPGCGDPDTRTYGFMIYLNRTTLDLPIGTPVCTDSGLVRSGTRGRFICHHRCWFHRWL